MNNMIISQQKPLGRSLANSRSSIFTGTSAPAKSAVLALLILSFTSPDPSAAPGETALEFLNIPIGAREASLGHGGFAGIEGPQAMFYNPSLLGNEIAGFASYQSLLLDSRSEAVAVALPIDDIISTGLGIYMFQPGVIEGYDSDNNRIGNLKSGDYLIRLSLARRGDVSYGLSFSLYGQRLDDQLGQGVGIGFGLSREFAYGRLALTADNFGPDFKIGTGAAPLPQRYSVSAWAPLREYRINVSLDLSYKPYIGFKPSGGIEYSPVSGFALRAGSNRDTPVAFGVGLHLGNIGLDYTYFPSGTFGDRHIISFSATK